MPGLHDLLVETHVLNLDYRITFLSRTEISDATINMLRRELDEHLGRAFEQRGMQVLKIESEHLDVTPGIDGDGR
jgi:hypothetical protein